MHHSQTFFNKYVNRAELFGLAFFTLILVLGGGLMKQSLDMRSSAAETGTELRGNSRTYAISGYVYFDQNQNGERDTEERGVGGTIVQINILKRSSEKVDQSVETKTDSYGYFKYAPSRLPDSFKYTLTLVPSQEYKVTSQNPLQYTYNSGRQNIKPIAEFGVYSVSVPTPTCMIEPTTYCIKPDGPCTVQAPPPGGFCPKPTCTPMPSECINPSSAPNTGPITVCLPPPGGWCPNNTPTPIDCTPKQKCGQELPACPTGTSCAYPGPIRSTPATNYYGTCIPDGCPLPL